MINKGKLTVLDSYIKSNIAPILLEGIKAQTLEEDAIIIPASIDKSELNGHYEGVEFYPPKWYQDLLNKSNHNKSILVIDDLSSISKEEQRKFIEILKYKKVSVFKLPKDCIIILTYHNPNTPIDEDIYSLVVHI